MVGIAFPRALRPVFVAWMVIVFPVSWLTSHLILACLFYGLFTPLAFVFRLIGRDCLGLGRRPEQESYWVAKPTPENVRSYFRQS